MNIPQTCPICSAHGQVLSLGAFGFEVHCSGCFDGDPEADHWRHLRGHGETVEDAAHSWLEDARELCAVDEIPPLPCNYQPGTRLIEQVLEQARAEFALQAGSDLVEGWRWHPSCDATDRVKQDVTYLEFPCAC